jgi:hypothetical protein
MTHEPKMFGRLRPGALIVVLLLASCAAKSPGSVSAPVGSDAPERLCSQFGFAPGTEALASCIARLDGLARQQAEGQKQCEGIRPRALAMPHPSGGIGNTIATSDADYQSCMNGQLTAPAQLQLPTGRSMTCRMIEQQIACD